MAWQTIDRNKPLTANDAEPVLTEAIKNKIRVFFDRYETKRAVLLPALHITQEALGHVGPQAMEEIAELLEIAPSEVLDTIGFYTHYWTHPKGKKVVVTCRSISCQVMGADDVLDACKNHLGIDDHATTEDGSYSLMTEECLAGCDHAPCLLINEKLHKRVKPEDVPELLGDKNNDQIDIPRSDLYDGPVGGSAGGGDSEAADSPAGG